jgi:hypothetical protein
VLRATVTLSTYKSITMLLPSRALKHFFRLSRDVSEEDEIALRSFVRNVMLGCDWEAAENFRRDFVPFMEQYRPNWLKLHARHARVLCETGESEWPVCEPGRPTLKFVVHRYEHGHVLEHVTSTEPLGEWQCSLTRS